MHLIWCWWNWQTIIKIDLVLSNIVLRSDSENIWNLTGSVLFHINICLSIWFRKFSIQEVPLIYSTIAESDIDSTFTELWSNSVKLQNFYYFFSSFHQFCQFKEFSWILVFKVGRCNSSSFLICVIFRMNDSYWPLEYNSLTSIEVYHLMMVTSIYWVVLSSTISKFIFSSTFSSNHTISSALITFQRPQILCLQYYSKSLKYAKHFFANKHTWYRWFSHPGYLTSGCSEYSCSINMANERNLLPSSMNTPDIFSACVRTN